MNELQQAPCKQRVTIESITGGFIVSYAKVVGLPNTYFATIENVREIHVSESRMLKRVKEIFTAAQKDTTEKIDP